MLSQVKPAVFGDDCVSCTPAIWAAGETPEKMLVVFEGMEKCPAAGIQALPNGTFIIEQDPIIPCTFKDASGLITWNGSPPTTSFQFASIGGFWFIGSVGFPCQFFANNNRVTCGPADFHGILGTCTVSPDPIDAVPFELCDSLNIAPVEDTVYDAWLIGGVSPPEQVTRLVNNDFNINVLIKSQT